MNREERRVIERYAYCLCLHVRPGTIFIGVINLAGSLLCGILYLVALGYHGSHDSQEPGRSHHMNGNHRSTATSLAIIIYMMCATVSGMLLYGVIKSRASYLMPFFGIQLCDFFFSLPAFLSSLYSTPSNLPNHWDSNPSAGGPPGGSAFLDVKRIWPNANPAAVYTSSLLLTTSIILFKGYFLCIVWKCYRYLKMKEMILPLHLPYQPGMGPEMMLPAGFLPPPIPPPNLAPPDYETATKMNAPPDYEAAIKTDAQYKYVPSPSPPASAAETSRHQQLEGNFEVTGQSVPFMQQTAALGAEGREQGRQPSKETVVEQVSERRMSSQTDSI